MRHTFWHSPIVQCSASISVVILVLALGGCNEDAAPVYEVDITVYEGTGRTQCQTAGGLNAQQSGLKLIRQGLDVKRSGCGVVTNVSFPAVCGAPTGELLLHSIPAVSLDVAERLGFKSVDVLPYGYAWVDCETRRVLP